MVNGLKVITLFLFIFYSLASAQEMPPSLIINSNPPGAQTRLEGPLDMSGITPTSFIQTISGKYDIKISKPGYESYNSSLVLEPGVTSTVSVNLKEKTRYKAALRSIFFPGWGQFYSEEKGKGFLFLALTASAGIAVWAADKEFRYREDLYNEMAYRYNQAGTIAERLEIYPELQSKRKKAYDAETVRLGTIYAVAGFWGLNVIDALFFFPDRRADQPVDGVSIMPNENFDGAKVVLSYSF